MPRLKYTVYPLPSRVNTEERAVEFRDLAKLVRAGYSRSVLTRERTDKKPSVFSSHLFPFSSRYREDEVSRADHFYDAIKIELNDVYRTSPHFGALSLKTSDRRKKREREREWTAKGRGRRGEATRKDGRVNAA